MDHLGMSISMAEVHWMGGYLTGKGCFDLDFCKPARPKLRVCSKDRQPLGRLKSLAGGGTIYFSGTWRLVITGRRVIALAFTIWSLVSDARKREIETMINGWVRG